MKDICKIIVLSTILISFGKGQCDEGEVDLWGECYSINIVSLDLTDSGLTGEIPPEIGELTNLTSLVLRYNELTGPIPSTMGNLTSLVKLELQYNNLSGSIPAELWSLDSLTQFRIQKNQCFPQIRDPSRNVCFS